MHINPPGTPQRTPQQPELHTFIGDTPQSPEPSELELREANFSAIRAHGDVQLSQQSRGGERGDEVSDIRTASPQLQADWVSAVLHP